MSVSAKCLGAMCLILPGARRPRGRVIRFPPMVTGRFVIVGPNGKIVNNNKKTSPGYILSLEQQHHDVD